LPPPQRRGGRRRLRKGVVEGMDGEEEWREEKGGTSVSDKVRGERDGEGGRGKRRRGGGDGGVGWCGGDEPHASRRPPVVCVGCVASRGSLCSGQAPPAGRCACVFVLGLLLQVMLGSDGAGVCWSSVRPGFGLNSRQGIQFRQMRPWPGWSLLHVSVVSSPRRSKRKTCASTLRIW
jgi:hypothetical protein